MKIERYEYIKASLTANSFSSLQDAVSVIRSLHEYDIEIIELIDYVIENQKIYAGETAKGVIGRMAQIKFCLCPKCGAGLRFDVLNQGRNAVITDLNEEGLIYQSMATCMRERECGWQTFSPLPMHALVRSFFPEKTKRLVEEISSTPHGNIEPL